MAKFTEEKKKVPGCTVTNDTIASIVIGDSGQIIYGRLLYVHGNAPEG